MKYRADIDGLRAIAVLSVLLYHGGATWFSGGYVGVDVFFVISGYVIALTLYDDLQSGRYTVWRFYSKRIRRIFPALFATILATAIVAWFILLPTYFSDFFASVIATDTFVSNIYFWKKSGYFAAAALSQPLLHTWSLAVEEQYYIFAPLAMYVVFRYLKKRWILFFLPLLLASLGASAYATIVAPTANFFLLPTRAWELLIGALLALAPPPAMRSKYAHDIFAAAGLAMIAFAVFTFSRETAFPGLNALYPCLGAAIIIYANRNRTTFVGKMLSLRPVVGIGKISYSLYLVHWPVIVFFYFKTLASPTPAQTLPIAAISIILAGLSWKFVEQPFRHLEGKRMQQRLLAGGVAVIAAFCFIGWIGLNAEGFPSRFPHFAEQKLEGKETWNQGTCFFEGTPDPKQWDYDKCEIVRGKNRTALLWGDSFVAQYVPGIVQNRDNIPYNVIQYTAAGCPPVMSYRSYARPWCTEFNARALDIIRQHHIDTVVISALWTDMESRGLDQIQSTLTALDKMGVETYVIGQSPEFSIDIQVLAFSKGGRAGGQIDKWNVFFDPAINRKLKSAIGDHSFVDPLQSLCEGNLCPYRDHGQFLFSDYGHFSPEGSARAVRAYFPLYRKE
jgi:peptidoglycan/LPS O-acetylase OafA/YrhL